MKIEAKYAIALTAALGLFMAVLDNTIVNIALTPMVKAFNSNLNSIQWVVTGYFLAQAAIIPAAGYFSNRFGIKRLFLISLVAFTIGSMLCGLAKEIGDHEDLISPQNLLIFFRVLQGFGGGSLFPLASALALQSFSPKERAGASAIIGVPVLLAPVFGPTIGGLLTDNFGWPYIFFVNLPIGIIAFFLGLRIFPPDKIHEEHAKSSFDYVGLSLSIIGVVVIEYAFTLVNQTQPGSETPLNPRGTPYGWSYALVWILISTGIALLTAFAVYELRRKDPVLDLRLFKQYNYTIASIVSWCNGIVVFGSLLMLPIFLENVHSPHMTAVQAGLLMMPQGIGAGIGTAVGGKLYNKIGVRAMVLIGAGLLTLSSWEMHYLSYDMDTITLIPWIVLRGLGFGLSFIPVQTLALAMIMGPALPKASSLFAVTRQIFSSVGIAIITTLFVQQSISHGTTLQADQMSKIPPGVKVDLTNPTIISKIETLMAQAGTLAMNDIFLIATFGTLLVMLMALALPNRLNQLQQVEGEQPAELLDMG